VIEKELSNFWAFLRGETRPVEFERWFLTQKDLEEALGEELHWDLTSANYADREEVRRLRERLDLALKPLRSCECPKVRNLSAIGMGSDFHRRFFGTLEEVLPDSPERWWRSISACNQCGTNWLIAADTRIYDDFFLRRLEQTDVERAKLGDWPDQFATYESVLALGREISTPGRFPDPMASSLVWTVGDLLAERPDIKTGEIAVLLNLSEAHVDGLRTAYAKSTEGRDG